jgi:hypothetical protein
LDVRADVPFATLRKEFPSLLPTPRSGLRGLQHAAPDLVQLDRFEQRAEITLAESLVALALDDLEEDGTDDRRREDLQEHLVLGRRAVQQDAVAGQALGVFLVTEQAGRELLVVRVRRVLERDAVLAQRFDGLI